MIALVYRGTEIGGVQWSADNRIAVATPECVYVLTIEGGRDTAAQQPIRCRISLASAPKAGTLPDVGVSPPTPEYHITSKDQRVRRFLDPLFFPPSGPHDPMKTAVWSPLGCTLIGGCVLTCLTAHGRVLVFVSPSSMETHWKQLADLTDILCSCLKECNYNIMQLNTTSSQVVATKPDEAFYDRCLMVAFTCCQWLPVLVGATGVVAVATRSGHVIVWGVGVPVAPGGRFNVLSVMDVATGKDTWVCSMCWSLCNNEVRLFVGCTNGSVFLITWEDVGDVLAGKVSSRGCVEIWAPDDIGVHQMAWQPAGHILAVTKCSMLVFLSVPPNLSGLPDYTFCFGLHTLPISGLCALSSGGFLSSSLDGSVRRSCVLPSGKCDMCPVELQPLHSSRRHMVYGVTVSSGCIFAAVLLRPNLEFSPKGLKHHSHIQFVKLADDNHVMKCLKEKGYQWDSGEYIRQHYETHGSFPLFISSNDSLRTDLRLRRHLEMTTGSDTTAVARALQYSHAVASLRRWLEWKGAGQGCEEERGTASLHHMVSLVQANASASEEELKLSHKVSRMVGKLEQPETCPICHCAVHNTEDSRCEKGHPVQRCCVTLCLGGEMDMRSCVQCSTPLMRAETVQKDPWLSHILSVNTSCIYCGGHFEQLFS